MNEYPDYLKSFSRVEYGAHMQKLQQEMGASGIGMPLLSSPKNIFYAIGYRPWYTSNLFRPVLVSMPRVGEPAVSLRILGKSTVENIDWCPNIYAVGMKSGNLGPFNSEGPTDATKRFLGELGYRIKAMGLKAGDDQYYVWSLAILKELTDTSPHLIFTDSTAAIQGARMIKTPWEIDRIRTTGWVTETAIVKTFRQIKSGITTEKGIAREIASRMTAGGVDRISYLTVNSSRDKYHTFSGYITNRAVDHKGIALVGISGHINSYASNLTRVIYLGHTPSEQYVRVAETARNYVHAGFDVPRSRIRVWEINQAIEGYLRGSGCGSDMVHSGGHSTGFSVTEYPNVSDDCHEMVWTGMVFTPENGVHPYDLEEGAGTTWISFRMEDEALVTENGAEWLSGSGKALYTMGDFC